MYNEDQLAADALADVGLLPGRTALSAYPNPADFIEHEMFIPETPLRPLSLHPEVRRVLLKMFERRADGTLRYMTMLFSMPKKSGKTTLAAGVALWQAYHVADGGLYIIGNDLDQANNRQMEAIRYCIAHNPRMADVRLRQNTAYLPNGTKIQAVSVDAAGESGANPTGIFWTEIWGAKQKKHEDFWTEMVLSPTRQGHSFKFCESYAGHSGESNIWERLYNAAVPGHAPVDPNLSPELYEDGSTIAYWCTRRLMPWQQGAAAEAYYAQEAKEKVPNEFRRQHMNEWVTSEDTFIPIEWWDSAKRDPLPIEGQWSRWVVGMDAGVTDDCFAIVALSKHDDLFAVRYARKWTPPRGGKLDFAEPEAEIRRLAETGKVACVVYDSYQLHDMATRLKQTLSLWFWPCPQGEDRLIADKRLYDLLKAQRIVHSGEPDLREHLLNANAKTDGDRLRIVKRHESLKIDLAVALSMAAYKGRTLNIE